MIAYIGSAVSLNGWHLKYLHSDHNVAGIVTMIRDIWDYGHDVSDHNLLQIGYNMEHSEIFNEFNKHYDKGFEGTTTSHNQFSFVNSGDVSWETYAIFKDNKTRRKYAFGEIVSELGGNDLGVVQPPFSILPVEDDSGFGCVSGSSGIRSDEYEIRDIPYQYAIPMLTGWELNYDCREDHNVKEIGIWIDRWNYERDLVESLGKLHYTLFSYMADKDGNPDFVYAHKVTVLGLMPLAVKGTSIK